MGKQEESGTVVTVYSKRILRTRFGKYSKHQKSTQEEINQVARQNTMINPNPKSKTEHQSEHRRGLKEPNPVVSNIPGKEK
jgi:hypothetical protein